MSKISSLHVFNVLVPVGNIPRPLGKLRIIGKIAYGIKPKEAQESIRCAEEDGTTYRIPSAPFLY